MHKSGSNTINMTEKVLNLDTDNNYKHNFLTKA